MVLLCRLRYVFCRRESFFDLKAIKPIRSADGLANAVVEKQFEWGRTARRKRYFLPIPTIGVGIGRDERVSVDDDVDFVTDANFCVRLIERHCKIVVFEEKCECVVFALLQVGCKALAKVAHCLGEVCALEDFAHLV